MTNRGSFRNFKLGQKNYKLGQGFKIGAEITNRGKRDFKSGHRLQIKAEHFLSMYNFLSTVQPAVAKKSYQVIHHQRIIWEVWEESVLSWDFSYSLIKLQNYSLCESLVNSSQVRESEKTTTTKSILKIFIGYLTGWVRFAVPGLFGRQKVTANLKSSLWKYSVWNKKQNQLLPATIKKIIFFLIFQENSLWFL